MQSMMSGIDRANQRRRRWRAGVSIVLGLVIGFVVTWMLAACGDNVDPSPTDAYEYTCREIGCTPTPAMCHPDGFCTCPSPDGRPITLECRP